MKISAACKFAMISVACPMVTASIALAWIYVSDRAFQGSLSTDAGWRAVGQIYILLLSLCAGSAIGLVPAVVGFRKQDKFFGPGLWALIFNSLPVVLALVWLWVLLT